jgi:hypothetical protein
MKLLVLPLGALSLIALNACTNTVTEKQDYASAPTAIVETVPTIAFAENFHDFGLIKQSGGKVTHNFFFTYKGKEPIIITGTPTSCQCTEAFIDKKTFNPGDTGVLTVVFNPNLHAEPEGRFYKTAMILSDPPLKEQPEVKIWTEIDLDLGPEAFELQEAHEHTGDEPENHHE